MALSTITLFCSHQHQPAPDLFLSSQTVTLYPLNTNSPLSLLPSAWQPPSTFLSLNLTPLVTSYRASQVALVVKNMSANAGNTRDCLIPGSGRSPGGGHGKAFQYSCLENPMDRGTSWATVYRVTKIGYD